MTTTTQASSSSIDQVPVGTWSIDPSHSTVGFEARHMMIAKVRGRFETFAATITTGPDGISVQGDADAASISTNDAQRDEHLRSADFFDATSHPKVEFTSTAVRATGRDRFEVTGTLSMRGVTHEVTFDATLLGLGRDPWGNERAAFEAHAEIDRTRWGLNWNQTLEAGGVLVGPKVKLQIEGSAVLQA